MKKRIGAVLLSLAVILALLAACGGGSDVSNSYAGGGSAALADAPPADMEEPQASEYGFTAESAPVGGAEEDVLRDAKMIRTANLEMETTAFDEAVEGLGRLTKEILKVRRRRR